MNFHRHLCRFGLALLSVAALTLAASGCSDATTSAGAARNGTQESDTLALGEPSVPTEKTETTEETVSTPPAASSQADSTSETMPVKQSEPTPVKKVARARDLPTRDVTFDDIQFEMEKGTPFERSMLTPGIEELVGRTIRIRGYMLPSFQQTGITQFVLVRDNMECCFGPGAALYDCIMVEMQAGASADFSVRPMSVEGTFTVNEVLDFEGKHLAIYHLIGKSAR